MLHRFGTLPIAIEGLLRVIARLRPMRAAATTLCLLAVLTSAAPASAAVQILPHRAIYELSLASTRNGSMVAGVDGKMSFVLGDACSGWTIEQKFDVRFQYAEGEDVRMSTSYVTWEAKDGRSYRFNVRKMVNGELDEELKGSATLSGEDGGKVIYEKPDSKEIALRPGTMFPSAHTIRLLELAAAGEIFFARGIFDGSEPEGAAGVSAVVGGRKAPGTSDAAKIDTAVVDLRKDKGWAVHLAFFPTDLSKPLPDYETSLLLLDSGIVQSMLIDYGDFKVNARLTSLESAPKPPC